MVGDSFAAPPKPPFVAGSVARVGMAPPVDDLRERVADREGDREHEDRARAAAARFFGFGFGGRACGFGGGALPPAGSTGSFPLIRSFTRLGFILRRKSASSASSGASLPLIPSEAAASWDSSSSRDAARSTISSALVLIS